MLLGKKKLQAVMTVLIIITTIALFAMISGKAVFFLPKRVQLDCLGRQCQHAQETNDKD